MLSALVLLPVFPVFAPLSNRLPAAVAQVTEVTGLTVRAINNVRKRMEVKPKFYDTFKGEGFPAEFSYNQKARGCDPNPTLCSLPPACRGTDWDQSGTSVHKAAAPGSLMYLLRAAACAAALIPTHLALEYPPWTWPTCCFGSADARCAARQVVLLFQRQDGVDVCLYCLYMQARPRPAPRRALAPVFQGVAQGGAVMHCHNLQKSGSVPWRPLVGRARAACAGRRARAGCG